MKIVLDTTILVRANEHSHGLATELLTTIIESEHTLPLSNEMLHELARVLRYPRLKQFYDLTENLLFGNIRGRTDPDTEPRCVSMRAAPIGEDRMLTHGGPVGSPSLPTDYGL